MAARHVLVAVVGVAGLLVTPAVVDARPAHPSPSGGTGDSATSVAVESVKRHLPPGFRDRVVYRAHEPTALAWTPDGRMLVTRKTGRLFVVRRDGSATQALSLRRAACINGSRGLISVAVDPRFRRNHYVYLYWTHDAHHECFSGGRRSAPQHRVTRYVLRDNDTIARRTATVIVDHIVSLELQHNAGDLAFGRDGFLYVSVGDGFCATRRPRLCGPDNINAQKLTVPHGKLLRVTRHGRPPASNPYADDRDARRCTRPAGVRAGSGPCAEIFARGLRNPFRIARRPGTNRFFVNDVGLYHWEEIDRLEKRGNYGWNLREGNCRTGSATQCGPTRFDEPLLAYPHDGCNSITGGAFVPRSLRGDWPRRFLGDYLFADYICGEIFRLRRQPDGDYTRVPFLTRGSGTVHLDFGPFRRTRALYYIDFNGGAVHRVTYRG